MINCLAILSGLIHKRLLSIAEFMLWLLVALGIYDVMLNGINSLSNLITGAALILACASLAFYLVALSCKLVVKSKITRWKNGR